LPWDAAPVRGSTPLVFRWVGLLGFGLGISSA